MLSLEYILAHAGHFTIRRNRRGNIGQVIRKQRHATVPLSNTGAVFQQELPEGGRVYALRGIVGSERPEPATVAL